MESILNVIAIGGVVYFLLIRPGLQAWDEVKRESAEWERAAEAQIENVASRLGAVSSWITEESVVIDLGLVQQLHANYSLGLEIEESWMHVAAWARAKGHFDRKRMETIEALSNRTADWLLRTGHLTEVAAQQHASPHRRPTTTRPPNPLPRPISSPRHPRVESRRPHEGASPPHRLAPTVPFDPSGTSSPFAYAGTGALQVNGPYAIVDVETSGLSPHNDRVLEIAILRLSSTWEVEDRWTTLVNPGAGAPLGPSHVHQIRRADLAGAPSFAEVAGAILDRLRGAVVVAHNASFEEDFLAAEFGRLGVELPRMPALCTLQLSREVNGQPRHRLSDICDAYGVPLRHAHTAMGDVVALSQVLPLMLARTRPLTFLVAPPALTSIPSSAEPKPRVIPA